MSSSLVSILTLTYNHERFIRQCVESVRGQTYANWEMIIIDDGSTDKTGEIVKSYSDARITYIYQQNQGVEKIPDNFNKALKLAKGDIIAILEGDDFWPSDKLEKQIPFFENEKIIVVYGQTGAVDEKGELLDIFPKKNKDLDKWGNNSPIGAILNILLKYNTLPSQTVMVRKSALDHIGGFKSVGLPLVDYPTWLELATRGEFYFVPALCGYWRFWEGQVTTKNVVDVEKRCAEYAIRFYDTLSEEVKKMITLSRGELERNVQHRVGDELYWRGGATLVMGKRAQARAYFRKSMRYFHSLNKCKVIILYAMTFLNLNFRRTYNIIKKIRNSNIEIRNKFK